MKTTTTLVNRVAQSLLARFRSNVLAQAELMNVGGKGGQFGYDFQDFVSVVKIVETALKTHPKALKSVMFRQNAEKSQVDDLHIISSIAWTRIQIKSEPDLTWEKKLRKEFRCDRILSKIERTTPPVGLELCVRSNALRDVLERNRARHKLGFVTVTAVDVDWMINFPPPSGELHELMKKLSAVPYSNDLLEGFWNQIDGCWSNAFRRRANLEELFERVSRVSGFAIKSGRLVPDIAALAEGITKNSEDLFLSADGETLSVKAGSIAAKVSLREADSDLADLLRGNPPLFAEDFFEIAGMFKEGD